MQRTLRLSEKEMFCRVLALLFLSVLRAVHVRFVRFGTNSKVKWVSAAKRTKAITFPVVYQWYTSRYFTTLYNDPCEIQKTSNISELLAFLPLQTKELQVGRLQISRSCFFLRASCLLMSYLFRERSERQEL